MEVAFININCWYQSDKRPLVVYWGEGLPLIFFRPIASHYEALRLGQHFQLGEALVIRLFPYIHLGQ
jgi:hypothetical protein